jgi:hypothetical protein
MSKFSICVVVGMVFIHSFSVDLLQDMEIVIFVIQKKNIQYICI